ncbi:MAG: InlB B-repeat-containing protein, partial [Peptostreptococcaceae bacterium]|nr:InlB B-repeat-containing protein [Peptostreptococcaceae bacterium]MDY5738962.1 InlB B-repeat-containing protein [Anaerovoracaceae bacterium]
MKKALVACIAFILSITLMPLQAFAYYEDAPVEINEENFPDEGLRDFLKWEDKYKGNDDGYIYPEEWTKRNEAYPDIREANITNNLYTRTKGKEQRKHIVIKNLQGLDKVIQDPSKTYYTTNLRVMLNPLCTITPKNPDGVWEPIVETERISVPDEVRQAITTVNICRSRLTEIDLKKYNRLSKLVLSNDDTETYNRLFIRNAKQANKTVFPEPGRLTKIDISDCTELDEVNISGQPIEKLDLSKNLKIGRISVANCRLAKLDIHELSLRIPSSPTQASKFSNQTVDAKYEIKNGKIHINLANLLEDEKYYSSVKTRNSSVASTFESSTGTLIYDTDDINKIEDPGYDFLLKDANGSEFTMDVHLKLTEEATTPTDKVTVTFDSHGGSEVSAETVEKGKIVSEPKPEPTKAEHKFLGWFTAEEGGDKWNFEAGKVEKDMTLHAHWEKVKYEVKSNVMGDETGKTTVTATPDKAAKGEVVKVDVANVPEGKLIKTITVDGQTIENGGTFTMPGKDVIVKVVLYDDESFVSVTFDGNGGTNPIPNIVKVKKGTTIKQPEDPKKDKYVFTGWYTSPYPKLGEKWNFDTDIVDNSMTLYAHWERFTQKVTTKVIPEGKAKIVFSPNKGGGAPPNSTVLVKLTDIEKGFELEKIIVHGVGEFKTAPTSFVMPNKPVTIEAILKETTDNVTVNFNSHGGSEVPAATVEKGKTVSEPTAPTKAEHKFLGWFTEEEGGDKWSFETGTVENDMTLHAHWEKVKYQVKTNVTGGTATVKVTPEEAAKDEKVKVEVTGIE